MAIFEMRALRIRTCDKRKECYVCLEPKGRGPLCDGCASEGHVVRVEGGGLKHSRKRDRHLQRTRRILREIFGEWEETTT